MSSSADFLARMFLGPESAPECPAPVQDCTGNWCEPFAWFDRGTQSWRTWQRSLVTGWELFSETWPRAGVMLSGIAFRRAPSAPLTSAIASGLLPTPTVKGDYNRKGASKTSGDGLATVLRSGPLPMLPTLRASDADRGGRGDPLTVLRGYETKHAGTLPTPTARDWRSGKASAATHGKNSRPLNETLAGMSGNRSGRMNPRFREWMMGLPIGHTECEPPTTGSFPRSPK